MPTNKNAQLRYQILDRCFSDLHHKYTIEDLLRLVNEKLFAINGSSVSLRQIRDDIRYMKDPDALNAPIEAVPISGRKSYYRYADPHFSIFNNALSVEEMVALQSVISAMNRFRGILGNAWLEDVISNLECRFGIKPNTEGVVSFEQNERLKGIDLLGRLIDAALHHQPLEVTYQPFFGGESCSVVHPYHLKQFNQRWFLIGLQQTSCGSQLTNQALDRMVKVVPSDVPFVPNETINFATYFRDVVGVTIPEDHPQPEEVILRFDEARFPYVVNKPIHASQSLYASLPNVIRLFLRPNKELEARILSYGPQVEVIAPSWFRAQISQKLAAAVRQYAGEDITPCLSGA